MAFAKAAAFDRVTPVATALRKDIHDAWMRPDVLHPSSNDVNEFYEAITAAMSTVHRFRSFSRMDCGFYLQEAIQDATEGLAALRLLRYKSSDSKPWKDCIMMIMTRGMSLIILQNLDDAYLDIRATCAALRITKVMSLEGCPTPFLKLPKFFSPSWHAKRA